MGGVIFLTVGTAGEKTLVGTVCLLLLFEGHKGSPGGWNTESGEDNNRKWDDKVARGLHFLH